MRHRLAFASLIVSLLAGCAARPVPVATPVAVAVAAPVATPAPFSSPVRVPPRLADGSFATPNRTVGTQAEALWHLRAGLNVAALGCRGADEAAIVAAYNALLATHRAEFAGAYAALTKQYGTGAAGTDRFDDAMTGLYNYYALTPARDGLCRTAQAVMADAAAMPVGTLGQGAIAALTRLDAPFVAVFTAQAAWLSGQPAVASVAAAAPAVASYVPPAKLPALAPAASVGVVRPAPRVVADPSVLTMAWPPVHQPASTAFVSR